MKRLHLSVALAAAFGFAFSCAQAASFTYHGSLQDGSEPANGAYDLELTLYSKRQGGVVLAGPVTVSRVAVDDGSFVTPVDFGPISLASDGWVDVRVRPAGFGEFTALDDRSPVAAEGSCPGAWSLDGNAGTTSDTNYIGTVDNTRVTIKSNNHTAAYFYPNWSVGLAYPDAVLGDYSTAIGYHAGTAHEGSTMIGGNDAFASGVRDSAARQFIVANSGGVGINTSLSGDGLPLRDELTIAPSPALPSGNADLTLETSTSAGYTGFDLSAEPNGYFVLHGLYNTGGALDYRPLMRINYSHNFGGYFALNGSTYSGPLTVGDPGAGFGNGAYVTTGGVWTNASSRSFKDSFAKVDVGAVLEKLVALPIQTWMYTASRAEGQHMGPVAEDFAAMFGLGNDDKHITTVDESGVAFAAIQGLNRKVESENTSLRRENADLRVALDHMSERLDRLEGRTGE
jgi:hypothetical protein